MSYSDSESGSNDGRAAGRPAVGTVAVRDGGAKGGGGGGGGEDAGGYPQWSSPLCDLCCEHSEPTDHLFAYFLPCFALGVAKQRADQTGVLFNALCFPICCTAAGPYSLVRIGYGIDGTARSDALIGGCLPCCAVRRLYTETRARPDPLWVGDFGSGAGEWGEAMGNFNDCGECLRALLCPCIVGHEIHTKLQSHSEMPTNKWLDVCCLLPCAMYGQTRATYGIPAKECFCEDCCCGGLFYPCGLTRAVREAGRREMTMRQRAYAAGAGAAGKTRQGLRIMAAARDSALRVVAEEVVARSVSRPVGMA